MDWTIAQEALRLGLLLFLGVRQSTRISMMARCTMKRLSGLVGLACLGVLVLPLLIAQAQPKLSLLRQVQKPKGNADVPRLIKELTDSKEEVSEAAVKALGETGLNAIEHLLKIFEKGDAKTRPMAARVLAQLRLNAIKAKRLELAESIEKVLLEALRDPDGLVVYAASAALTSEEPRSKKAISYFIEILKSDEKTAQVRGAANRGLRKFGPAAAEAIPVLLDCLNNKVERAPDVAGKSQEEKNEAYEKSTHYVDGERGTIGGTLLAVGPKDKRVIAALYKVLRNPKEDEQFRAGLAIGFSKMGETGQAILPDLMQILKETKGRTKEEGPLELRAAVVKSLSSLKLSGPFHK
jgi:HEAT repeat protein